MSAVAAVGSPRIKLLQLLTRDHHAAWCWRHFRTGAPPPVRMIRMARQGLGLSSSSVRHHLYFCSSVRWLGTTTGLGSSKEYNSSNSNSNSNPNENSTFTDEEAKAVAMVTEKFFKVQDGQEKNRESFQGAIDIFTHRDSRRRGTVEFIYAALRNMEHFGVHRDLASYKKLMGVFPKGKMIPDNRLIADFVYYPKQQQCAIDVLVKMELNKVIPDEETGDLILNIFGKYSIVFKRYCRMMYWMPKFKNLSPWPLPFDLPKEATELAKLAIRQITSVDPLTKIQTYNAEDLDQSTDKTWIVSGQSPDQMDLIQQMPEKTALYVEGAFRLWLDSSQVNYFILRGPPVQVPPPPTVCDDEISEIRRWMDGVKPKNPSTGLARRLSVHEQEDGTVLAVCATGTSSRDSLLSWIRFLEMENPRLAEMAVLFTLQSPLGPVIPVVETAQVSRS